MIRKNMIFFMKVAKQISVCAWLYPRWSRWNSWIGFLEIRTPETMQSQNPFNICIGSDENEFAYIYNTEVHYFRFQNPHPYIYILRKWIKVCASYDFEKNEGQVAMNGQVSELAKNPTTSPNFNGSFDGGMIKNASPDTDMFIIFGRYFFDRNPFIGFIANINAWDRSMDATELAQRTSCQHSQDPDQGNLVNEASNWNLTGSLVKKISIPLGKFLRNRPPIEQLLKEFLLR